jgi:mannose-6-phosphate isomerase
MSIEKASVRRVFKPWGRTTLSPWLRGDAGEQRVGEAWFERSAVDAAPSKLLLKLLFTSESLSVQVHPDDATARAMGLENGKTEAWVVLSAEAQSRLALGVREPVDASALRGAVSAGTVGELLAWQKPHAGDALLVPAGTIHAIGAGFVLAEIQQRSDATFRLFDHGRDRELHVDAAIAAADLTPNAPSSMPQSLGTARTILATSQHFVLERLRLAPGSRWRLNAQHETWLLTVRGVAAAGSLHLGVGEAAFAENAQTRIVAGDEGADILVAYAAPVVQPDLLASSESDSGPAASPSLPRTSADERTRNVFRLPGARA